MTRSGRWAGERSTHVGRSPVKQTSRSVLRRRIDSTFVSLSSPRAVGGIYDLTMDRIAAAEPAEVTWKFPTSPARSAVRVRPEAKDFLQP